VSLAKLTRSGLLALSLTALAATSAGGALVEVGDIVLHADGGFQPRSLPRHRFVPIEFQGHFDVAAKGGGRPSPLRQLVIDFDHDGRLSVAGLPRCRPDQIDEEGTREARETCPGAIVGTGRVEAIVSVFGGQSRGGANLTVFNGPPIEGLPSAVIHARITAPTRQVFAILVPIERRPGPFRYRATIDFPPIAEGLGSIAHVDVQIGRRYRAGGTRRSYVSARCSDNILETHGHFSFEDGTVIDGQVEKYCHAK
jgi:hypothetical protein